MATEEATGTRLWSNVVQWRKLPADPQPAPPWRGAFYYPWYPESWSVGTHFTPLLGRYASGDSATIDRHLDMLRYGRFEVGISSWWSPQHHSNANLPLMLNRVVARRVGFRWAVYYECEGNDSTDSPACGPTKDPSVRQLADHLTYLWRRYGGHPAYMRIWRRMVVFVYSAGDGPSPGDDPADPCEVLRRWKRAQIRAAIDVHLVMKIFSGYRDCPDQPESWHQYGPSSGVQAHEDASGNLVSYVISPGFWHADDPTPVLPRNMYAWRQRVRNMNASSARWKLVTTFNEWGEGTAIEAAREWPSTSGYGDYLDALHSPR